jgi:hypothetical protein
VNSAFEYPKVVPACLFSRARCDRICDSIDVMDLQCKFAHLNDMMPHARGRKTMQKSMLPCYCTTVCMVKLLALILVKRASMHMYLRLCRIDCKSRERERRIEGGARFITGRSLFVFERVLANRQWSCVALCC